jgi:hypothetical protein
MARFCPDLPHRLLACSICVSRQWATGDAFSAADFNCHAPKKGTEIAFLRTGFLLATIRFNFWLGKNVLRRKGIRTRNLSSCEKSIYVRNDNKHLRGRVLPTGANYDFSARLLFNCVCLRQSERPISTSSLSSIQH